MSMGYTPSVVIPTFTKKQTQKQAEPQKQPSVTLRQPAPTIKLPEAATVPEVASVPEAAVPEVSPSGIAASVPEAVTVPEAVSVPEASPSGINAEYAQVQELYYFPLEDAREALYKAFHTDAAESTLSYLAKRVANLTFALQNFWDRYHLAVDEQNGKPIIEEVRTNLENVRKKYSSLIKKASTSYRELSSYTKAEIDEMASTSTIPSYIVAKGMTIADIKAERIKRDVKYLRRNDRKAGSDYRESLEQAATELHEWGIKISEAMERSCAMYGYIIPPEWVTRPRTAEEKAKAKNEANKARYHKKTAIARELRQALAEEQASLFRE